MVLLHLPGVRRHPSAAVPAPADRRGRNDHDALPRGSWSLPRVLHSKLDIQVSNALPCTPRTRVFPSNVSQQGLACAWRTQMSFSMLLVIYSMCVCVMTTCSGYRYATEGTVDPIAVTAGIVQTGLYIDFFYVYFTK